MIKTNEISANTAHITVDSLQELDKAIKAFGVIGLTVKKICTGATTFVDLDTKFYNRYPESTLDKVYRVLAYGMGQELTFKNNRLYVTMDGIEIVLPKTMTEKPINLRLYF